MGLHTHLDQWGIPGRRFHCGKFGTLRLDDRDAGVHASHTFRAAAIFSGRLFPGLRTRRERYQEFSRRLGLLAANGTVDS